jgi:hypothetical protein
MTCHLISVRVLSSQDKEFKRALKDMPYLHGFNYDCGESEFGIRSCTGGIERMRMDSNGNIGIGIGYYHYDLILSEEEKTFLKLICPGLIFTYSE